MTIREHIIEKIRFTEGEFTLALTPLSKECNGGKGVATNSIKRVITQLLEEGVIEIVKVGGFPRKPTKYAHKKRSPQQLAVDWDSVR